uniref:SAM domain-containing protein n=1 Tax=Guillardia theta TaxID=55529 RepID=A0A7S4UY60_GUITH
MSFSIIPAQEVASVSRGGNEMFVRAGLVGGKLRNAANRLKESEKSISSIVDNLSSQSKTLREEIMKSLRLAESSSFASPNIAQSLSILQMQCSTLGNLSSYLQDHSQMMKDLRDSIGHFSADVQNALETRKQMRQNHEDVGHVPWQGIDHFLAQVGLSQLASKFKEQELTDVRTLKLLTDQDLRDLQIDTIGAKRRLLSAIKNLQVSEGSLSSSHVQVQADTMSDMDGRDEATIDQEKKRARETPLENAPPPGMRHSSIVVRNLAKGITEKMLFDFFSASGGVKSIKLLPFNPRFDTRVAYVNFIEDVDISHALQVNGTTPSWNEGLRLIVIRQEPNARSFSPSPKFAVGAPGSAETSNDKRAGNSLQEMLLRGNPSRDSMQNAGSSFWSTDKPSMSMQPDTTPSTGSNLSTILFPPDQQRSYSSFLNASRMFGSSPPIFDPSSVFGSVFNATDVNKRAKMPWETKIESDNAGMEQHKAQNPSSFADTLQSITSKFATPAAPSFPQSGATLNLSKMFDQGSQDVPLSTKFGFFGQKLHSQPIFNRSMLNIFPSKSDGRSNDSEEAADVEHEVPIERGSGIVQLERVNVTTGEENEKNLFSAEQVKLYEFQKEETDQNAAGSWKSRGSGILRLKQSQDDEAGKARTRVIIRQTGSLAVLVNSALFPGMACNKGGEKGVIFTGSRDGALVTYLVKFATRDEANELHNLIKQNVQVQTQ